VPEQWDECALAVALENTPGMARLPNVAAELNALPGAARLVGPEATVERTAAALTGIGWAHFACHASTDAVMPSRGGLHLYDGTLSASAISRLPLTGAELAYLSACSTADGGWRHADECLHLASACQLAGFRHVVASLWPLGDDFAPAAARMFYQGLGSGPAAGRAATVLHHVALTMRERYPERPDQWAALVHWGP
jgi:CHAT domain-containing protein